MPQDYNLTLRIAYLQWLASEDAAEEAWVRTLRDYVGGKHPVYLTDRQKEFLGLKAKNTVYLYAHNLCQLVIDALVERLSIEAFAAAKEAEQAGAAALLKAVETWQEANRFDTLQSDVYEAACRDGAAYLIVDWDAETGMPRWTLNQVIDGTKGVRVYEDPNTGKIQFAAKKWQVYDPVNTADNGRTRQTLYYSDRVEKYISSEKPGGGIGGTGWEEFKDTKDEPWPIPWVDAQGKPLGLPVVEFANPGGSEIEQLTHLQDMLNKADLDLIACTDTAGFRILWVAGVTPTIDTDGNEKPLEVGPGQLVRLTDATAKMNAIEPVDSKQLIETCKYWIESIAGVSRTPQYLFQVPGGTPPSGESLQQQQSGLVRKAERRQRVYGNSWEDVMYLSAKLHNLYRPAEAVEIVRLQAQWASAQEFVDEDTKDKVKAETALIKQQVGVSQDTLVEELGYDPAAERRKREAGSAELGARLLDNFDHGEEQSGSEE